MKKITKDIVIDSSVGIVSGVLGGMLSQWYWEQWELSVIVGIILFAGGIRSSATTYFALRRNPEYQKDTQESG